MSTRRLIPSWPAHMFPDASPAHGDVIISRTVGTPGAHVLWVIPNGFETKCGDYVAALNRARRFAQLMGVDVWVRDEEDGFALVARHRVDRRQA